MNIDMRAKDAEARTVLQVKKVIKKWPAYRKYIEGVLPNPLKFKNLSELPIIDKNFIAQAIHTVPLMKVRNIIPSSGSTGCEFSFGLFGTDEMKRSSVAIEAFLRKKFRTDTKKTLLLNLLPGAMSIHSSSVTVASIGVRTDTAISAIESLGSSFEQIILAGEPLFIKKLVEHGIEQSIVWKYLPLYIVTGGEWISESYRRYIEGMIGQNRLYSSMGMAELGLNYFFETDETLFLRKMLAKDRRLTKTLFGGAEFCPMLFSYDPRSLVVETVRERDEAFDSIILTTVDSDRVLPLIRYKSGDKGKKLSWSEINTALISFGYRPMDDTGLPVLAQFGRGRNVAGIYPEMIKEVLYSSPEIASATTGNFFIRRDCETVSLEIQCSENVVPHIHLRALFSEFFSGIPVSIGLQPFESFPYALDFERKVQYVCESVSCMDRRREEAQLPAAV
jgi:phenylacetate-CoA ligase